MSQPRRQQTLRAAEKEKKREATRSPFIRFCLTAVAVMLIGVCGLLVVFYGVSDDSDGEENWNISSLMTWTNSRVTSATVNTYTVAQATPEDDDTNSSSDPNAAADPNSSSTPLMPGVNPSGTPQSPNAVRDELHSRLAAMGYNEVAIAGILGNFQQECHFDITATSSGSSSSGAIGLAQWMKSRRIALLNKATSMNKDWTDLEVQWAYLVDELNGPYSNCSPSNLNDPITYCTNKQWYDGSSDAVTCAAYAFMRLFEGCVETGYKNYPNDMAHMVNCYQGAAERMQNAHDIYATYGGS